MAEVPHIITAAPFTPVKLEPIFLRAEQLRELRSSRDGKRELRQEMIERFMGVSAVNFFYQESTRTRISFEMAEIAMGIPFTTTTAAKEFSSVAKGETLEHTAGVLSKYGPDFLVLRHDKVGGAERAARVSGDVPIINGGDGPGEHPTQAIGDTYAIWEHFGRLDNLRFAFMGDLKYSRTIRSLVHVLAKGDRNHFDFVSHPKLRLSKDIRDLLKATPGVTFNEHFDREALYEILPYVDVFNVTRTQVNLGAKAPKSNVNKFRVTPKFADLMPEGSIIIHPMPIFRSRSRPKLSEIDPRVDHHPRAYWEQAAAISLFSRMTVIEGILESRDYITDLQKAA